MTSQDIYFFKKCDRLKDAVIKIFGDIVQDAYVATAHSIATQDRFDHKSDLAKVEESIRISDSRIDHSAECVVIKFTTGKLVYFYNSEWGDFGNPENYKILD